MMRVVSIGGRRFRDGGRIIPLLAHGGFYAQGLLCAQGFYACEPGYSTLIFGAFGLSSLPPLSSDLESGASTGGKPLSRRQIS